MADLRARGLLDGDGSYVENRPTKWQQTLGILNEYNPVDAFWRLYDSDMAKGGPITDSNIADAMTVTGMVTGGSALAPKSRNALNMGIRAYHGSPHDFDKFSMDKIGTGEGAQVYGHGLYFAENEGVAKGYRDRLTRAKDYSTNALIKKHGGIDQAITAAEADLVNVQDQRKNIAPEHFNALNLADKQIQKRAELLDRLLKLKLGGDGPGRTYEVDINAEPNQFIDYDRPLGEQPDVTSKLRSWEFGIADWERSKIGPDPRTLTGGQWLARTTKDPAKMSSALRESGIPGVKYLDAGSRSAGDGTRNYVVFDDKLINILKKYGVAGLLGSSAAYNAVSGRPQEQY